MPEKVKVTDDWDYLIGPNGNEYYPQQVDVVNHDAIRFPTHEIHLERDLYEQMVELMQEVRRRQCWGSEHIGFTEWDFNRWKPCEEKTRTYTIGSCIFIKEDSDDEGLED